MKNNKILSKDNLNYKILQNIFIFLSQSKYFRSIDFKNFNKISYDNKLKCLYISKNISLYICKNNIDNITNTLIEQIISNNFKNQRFKLYIKNIELIKFYTILFTEKSCSHLTFYLFNNLNTSETNENSSYLSIVIGKNKKFTLILNEQLDIFIKKHYKKTNGELFIYKNRYHISSKLKQNLYLFLTSVIIGYILIYNIPSNHIILEMNLTMHMKSNHRGYIISYKPKTSSARTMIKNIKKLNPKVNNTLSSFINYGLENNILKPGEKVKIYIIGPPLNDKFFENLKNYLKDVPLNIVINNSGNLIKINRSY